MKQYDSETQARLAEILKVKEAVENDLFRIPGVHGVGISLKTTKGARIPEFAIVVHVYTKKVISALSPEHVIPSEINGVKTDVVERSGCTPIVNSPPPNKSDSFAYDHLVGGSEISGGPGINPSSLGCFAQVRGSKQIALLTCAHSFYDIEDVPRVEVKRAGGSIEKVLIKLEAPFAVGQPNTSSICCDHTVAHVRSDVVISGYVDDLTDKEIKNYPDGVDAGIAFLDLNKKWVQGIIKKGEGKNLDIKNDTEEILGAYFITDSDALFDLTSRDKKPIYRVHKRGAKTRFTNGFVVNIHLTLRVTYGEAPNTLLLNFKNNLDIQPETPGTPFAHSGDSGAVVLNSDHMVVGLIVNSVINSKSADGTDNSDYGFGGACPIEAVQNQLQIDVVDARDFPGVRVIKAARASAELTNLAPDSLEVSAVPRAMTPVLAQAQQEILQTDLGRNLFEAVQRHASEIRNLVNNNKRVATVWHKAGGPIILQELVKAARARDIPLPSAINSRPFADCVKRIFAVLRRYGSPNLKADIDLYGPKFAILEGATFNHVLAALRNEQGNAGEPVTLNGNKGSA